MLLASRIACRNESVPLSLVFVTIKTNGTVVLCNCGDPCATVGAATLEFVTRVERVNRVVRNALPKVDASKIDEIDNSATVKITRRAKACEEVFFFILFVWGETQELSVPYNTFFYGDASQKSSEKPDRRVLEGAVVCGHTALVIPGVVNKCYGRGGGVGRGLGVGTNLGVGVCLGVALGVVVVVAVAVGVGVAVAVAVDVAVAVGVGVGVAV
jgi:hypothetical protein